MLLLLVLHRPPTPPTHTHTPGQAVPNAGRTAGLWRGSRPGEQLCGLEAAGAPTVPWEHRCTGPPGGTTFFCLFFTDLLHQLIIHCCMAEPRQVTELSNVQRMCMMAGSSQLRCYKWHYSLLAENNYDIWCGKSQFVNHQIPWWSSVSDLWPLKDTICNIYALHSLCGILTCVFTLSQMIPTMFQHREIHSFTQGNSAFPSDAHCYDFWEFQRRESGSRQTWLMWLCKN